MKFFYNNWGIRALIIYFCFAFIDLINDYKNIYSHNVCLGDFMCINTFKNYFKIKGGYAGILRSVGMLFLIIFSVKGLQWCLGVWVKMCEFCEYAFLMSI